MDPGLVLERTKRFSAMLRYFSRNLSGSHQNNALSYEKTPRFLYIPLFIQQALHYCFFNRTIILNEMIMQSALLHLRWAILFSLRSM